jgi:hypothetical protein
MVLNQKRVHRCPASLRADMVAYNAVRFKLDHNYISQSLQHLLESLLVQHSSCFYVLEIMNRGSGISHGKHRKRRYGDHGAYNRTEQGTG